MIEFVRNWMERLQLVAIETQFQLLEIGFYEKNNEMRRILQSKVPTL